MKPCVICYKPDEEKPTIYRGTPWCCGQHRKMADSPIPSCANLSHDHESADVPGHGMFCADCLRPLHYNHDSENYYHDSGDDCFLAKLDSDPCRQRKPKMKAKKSR